MKRRLRSAAGGRLTTAALALALACGGADSAGQAPGADASAGAADTDARDGTSAPDFGLSGPILLTTSEMLREAYERIEGRREPFWTAWQRVRQRAEDSLGVSYETYRGTDHEAYFRRARGHGLIARASAIAFRLTEDARYLERTTSLLSLWAEDGAAYPFSLDPIDHSAGLVLGRVSILFGDAYALVHHEMAPSERAAVEAWLASYVPVIQESQRIWVEEDIPGHPAPYLGRQYFNNHLGAQTMGLVAIGYATGNDALVAHGLSGAGNPRDLETLIGGAIVMGREDLYTNDPTLTDDRPDPLPGEIFDRYRTVQGHGLHYSQLHLRLLTLMALMARHNGWPTDYFDFTGSDGERLLTSYEVYAPFVVSGRADELTGYYAGDSGVEFEILTLLEIANRFHPGRPEITRALSARSRVFHDTETFGWTAPLIHGTDDINDAVGRWEFDRDGDAEGWRVRRGLSMSVAGGTLLLDVTGTDPAIMSPDILRLPAEQYGTLTLRIKNETPDDLCQVFFVTDAASDYTADQRVNVTLIPNDSQLRDYTVDLSSHPAWTGTVRQVRVDVVSGGAGRVLVDAIRLH